MFVEKTVNGLIRGAMNTNGFQIIKDSLTTVRGRDGGALSNRNRTDYLRNDGKNVEVHYIQSPEGGFSNLPVVDTRPLYRLDLFVRGVQVLNNRIDEAVRTPLSSRSNSDSSTKSAKSAKSAKA